MKQEVTEIELNGTTYVRKDSVQSSSLAPSVDGLRPSIIRTYSAGVFLGYIHSRNGQEAKVLRARRLWYWSGAASLSQLAVDGTTKPNDCKFPCEVAEIELLQVIEIIPVTEKSLKSINSVKIWEQK